MNTSNLLFDGMTTGPTLQRPPDSRQCVLVVDDDPEIRRLNAEVLRCAGFLVDTAEDGATAWMAIQQESYDLIVIDNLMPKMTGIELLQALHEAHQLLPVIMATASVPQRELDRHPWLEIQATLLKPYAVDELLDMVENVLHPYNHGAMEKVPPVWLPIHSSDPDSGWKEPTLANTYEKCLVVHGNG